MSNTHAVNAIHEWKRRLAQLRANGMSAADAVRKLVRENPKLHAAYIAAANAGRGRRR